MTRAAQLAKAASGTVLQVVQGVKSDISTYSGVDAYHFVVSASITPTSTTSRILVTVFCQYSTSSAGAQYEWMFYLDRNGTQIGLGTNPGNRQSAIFQPGQSISNDYLMTSSGGSFMDSPSSMSSLTYSLKLRSHTNPVHVNRSGVDTDSTSYSKRGITTITLMEIAG